jgi:hypothetical protein
MPDDERRTDPSEALYLIAASLQGIEASLRQIALSTNPAPNYQRLLSEYPGFDWTSIGATILKEDRDGVTTVEWNGQVFTRRAPSNKFGAPVWYSRCTGKDTDGNNRYARLITFKGAAEAEPIAGKARKAIDA